MLPTIGVDELEEQLTGILKCPLPFVKVPTDSGTSVKQQNPQYQVWKRYDKLLISWLLVSMSECMFSHISKYDSANAI